jgi:hypothetical protein
MGEEIHKVNCEPNILLVEHSDFISEGFEIIPGLSLRHWDCYYSPKKITLFKQSH